MTTALAILERHQRDLVAQVAKARTKLQRAKAAAGLEVVVGQEPGDESRTIERWLSRQPAMSTVKVERCRPYTRTRDLFHAAAVAGVLPATAFVIQHVLTRGHDFTLTPIPWDLGGKRGK